MRVLIVMSSLTPALEAALGTITRHPNVTEAEVTGVGGELEDFLAAGGLEAFGAAKAGDPVVIRREAYNEALSALTGARAALGDVANISHAIDLLQGAVEGETKVRVEEQAPSTLGEGKASVSALKGICDLLGKGAIQGELATKADEVPEVASRDTRFDPEKAAAAMLKDVLSDEVVAVTLAGITSTGAVRLYSSESTGQTLNLLAQAIKVADGTLAPDDDGDDDTPERIRSDD